MKVAILSGTVRVGRYSHFVAEQLVNQLKERVDHVDLVDIKAYNLPLLEYTFPNHPNPSADMTKLHQILDEADAFILVSPEYNGGPCAALKNTMDYFKKEYAQKVMAISTVSSGSLGGMRAATTMQQMVLWYGGYPIPQMLTVPNVQNLFTPEGKLQDGSFTSNVNRFLDAFVWLSAAVVEKKKSDRGNS